MQTLPLPLEVHQSHRFKNLRLSFTKKMTLRLSVPSGYPKAQYEAFIDSKYAWIVDTFNLINRKKSNIEHELEMHKGEILLFDEWVLLSDFENPRENMREILYRYLSERIAIFSQKMGLFPRQFSIRKTKNRLGSCDMHANLNFSLQLVFAPKEQVDYVIMHELAHIAYHDHSHAFWSILERYCENYRALRSALHARHALHLKLYERLY